MPPRNLSAIARMSDRKHSLRKTWILYQRTSLDYRKVSTNKKPVKDMELREWNIKEVKALVQRVAQAEVTVKATRETRSIGPGLVIFLGVSCSDGKKDAEYLADKVVKLRIFNDFQEKMNDSLLDQEHPSALIVSQFTLYGNTQKGRRPSFLQAADSFQAEPLYTQFIELVRGQGVHVETGDFGADMVVLIANDGPVTLTVDSP